MKALHFPRSRARRRDQRGVATVELALVLMPLVLLLAATADLGRAFYTYSTLTSSTRNATRFLALSNPLDDTAKDRARNLVRYGNIHGTGTLLVSNLSADKIEICTRSTCGDHDAVATGSGTVNLVSVRISGYVYTSLFSAVLPAQLAFSTINMTMRSHPCC
ncbi:TadE/TadG family type IV pilus assembly protein [Azohydromonas aeria]|uniref:TadE/TadG family type IV pilus assembly protein n=1 Tax=Azohydromonas aeria TaxID=2590212 RepID=UPI0012FA25A1|nr:TadE/TadG family type IV pilus assembly protein [Azohydromonas aeria]